MLAVWYPTIVQSHAAGAVNDLVIWGVALLIWVVLGGSSSNGRRFL